MEIGTNVQIDSFKQYFTFDPTYKDLKEIGMNVGFDTMSIRSIAWRVFLGSLKGVCGDEWIEQVKVQREKYQVLVDKLENGPIREANLKKLNSNIVTTPDPLSNEHTTPWCMHFDEMDVEKRVSVDVLRLFSEYSFFKNEDVREHIKRVCVIYSLEHMDLQYNQGFHELVGVMFYALSQDLEQWKLKKAGIEQAVLNYLFDEQYLEHDAYTLFSLLMNNVRDFYDPSETRNSLIESPDGSSTHTKLMLKCEKLFKELEKLDNQMYLHLKYDGIHLVLFGTRWLRLLFDREFLVNDVLNIWDAIFSYGNDLEFVDYLFLAMVIYIREPILKSLQYSTTMMFFMKYPDTSDVRDIIVIAKQLAEKKGVYDPLPYIKIESAAPPVVTTKTKRRQASESKKEQEKKQLEAVKQESEKQYAEQQSKKKEELTKEFVKVKVSQSIKLLQSSISNEGTVSDISNIIEALSELKLIKALMNDMIPPSQEEELFKELN
ncbi:hypothetical protein EIN_023590 [Entamoeba invadens IP1]|uniref:hypothetical protein n=1 Tax=Entamoeba invadens IP1 TaxID=370355 RepID=UPI0002C3E618|nr:hypothetical protein EIN_023590 [Entamoeba invadens IP1]ELP90670.1 hypothetical protein EIN_023590 [Entamoeba invadens IP1]|eukprot:XP_004257441.1 hypothetical protein EIN_023590 [Entamoeba invadens IP1]